MFIRRGLVLSFVTAAGLVATLAAQDRLKSMPGYDQYQKMSKEMTGAVRPGALSVTWRDPRTFEYARDGKLYRYDVATKNASEVGAAPEAPGPGGRGGRGGMPMVERGPAGSINHVARR